MQVHISIMNLFNIFSLIMNKKERTDIIYNPKYKVEEPFNFPPKEVYDKSNWNFRKYKKYDEFTKTFDSSTNIEVPKIKKNNKQQK